MARLARFILLTVSTVLGGAILYLLNARSSPSDTIWNVWGSKEEAVRVVGGQVPSVPDNISADTDVGRSDEPSIPRQPSTTVVSSEPATVTPASLLAIHLVVV